MTDRLYQEPLALSREEAEAAFCSKDNLIVCNTLVSVALNDPDWHWVQEKCLYFIGSPTPEIRGLAATCFGHLARIHGKLDLERVLPVLNKLGKDPEIGGRVEDALDDIETFIGKQ